MDCPGFIPGLFFCAFAWGRTGAFGAQRKQRLNSPAIRPHPPSPSAAATVIHGGRANGLTAWKNKSGKTLKQLESAPDNSAPNSAH